MADYVQNQHQRAAECYRAVWKRHVDFTGKKVLDVGCGLGGKSCFYSAATDSWLTVGLDRDIESLSLARKLSTDCSANLFWLCAPIERMPLLNEWFDIIIAEDVFEHVMNPEESLRECIRVLRPGGSLIIELDPLYYSRFGSHLYDCIHIPWAHLFIPHKILYEVAEQQLPRGGIIDPQVLIDQFKTLNRLTSARFNRIISNFPVQQLYVQDRASHRRLGNVPFIQPLFIEGRTMILRKT